MDDVKQEWDIPRTEVLANLNSELIKLRRDINFLWSKASEAGLSGTASDLGEISEKVHQMTLSLTALFEIAEAKDAQSS